MGCGGSNTEEDRQNALIELQLKSDRDRIQKEIKLLLLGTGESGKSTIAKQMKIMHLDGFTKEEKETYLNILHSNIVDSMAVLVRQAGAFGYELPAPLQASAERFGDQMELASFINPQSAKEIAALWNTDAVRKTFERKAEYQLPGSVDYLMANAERLLTTNASVVTDDDILRCRMRTTGIVEIDFEIEKSKFKMVDVGGQRSERKKWFHCFADVTAVLFCVALNEYDEKLFEDERVNRMTEALKLFGEVCNNRFFNAPKNPTSMVIFLNKSDLFQDKIKKVPLTVMFPEYTGGADFNNGTSFIKQQFLAQSKDPNKLIFTHVTCATDTAGVRIVFNAVRTTILHKNLSDASII